VILLKIEGLDLEVLDAGCCGMAGAFGYEAAHFPANSWKYSLDWDGGYLVRQRPFQEFPSRVPAHPTQALDHESPS
jgi:hypothetical protein